ncbi:HlyD family secretion protein [Xanthomonas campestris]|uniref:HlyD family secretion protein n=1 Tax=Xanthomonas TaxID=338 RepID=UPI001E2E255E|nr:HlyD family efflux transporter periplasmic adaptor subunit [Xanthomonas campestris]MCC5091001.1 HlyD family efflux transporter periplasmic adaptor subunit [Xanthomonas campestris]
MNSLYRKEIYEHRQSQSAGSIILRPPGIGWAFLVLSGCFIIAAILFLVFGHYVRHETVSGYLVPDGGITAVPAPVPGVLVRVIVHEGQRVSAGETLAEVVKPHASVRWGNTSLEIEKQLLSKRMRIQEEIGEQRRLRVLQEKDSNLHASSLVAQKAQISTQLEIQQQRLRDATEIYRMWQQADSGVISKMQLAQQHDAVLQVNAQIADLSRQRLLIERSMAEVRSVQQQRSPEANSSQIVLEKQLADVDQAIYENSETRDAVIKAPAEAIVGPIYANAGQSLEAGQPLLSLYPPAAPLLAELWVPPKSGGFVRAGQQVLLRYKSFPYERFGQYAGVVRSISSTPIDPANIRAVGVEVPKAAAYRVLVSLEYPYVSASTTGRLPLKPGLDVDAAIQLDRRTLAEWLFEPIYGAVHRWGEPGHGASKND